MERLTVRDNDGHVAIVFWEDCKSGPACFECEQKVADCLAAYEDTGPEPADIKDLRNELCLQCGNYERSHLGACNMCRWRKEETK